MRAEGTNNENLPETHAVLKRMRAVVDANYQDRMFLAEANQWPEDVREYFGDGDECHVAYHFPLMPRIFMAVALEDRYPIAEILRQTPDIPENCQWAIFLRNHDELTLEMVTDRERDYMYKMYAQEPRMRVNVGIRRRLAPLLGNDVDRIKLMNSLLLSMPGSPIMYYGDEIGMGDNIYIGDRNGVRTPMQWSIDRNAGFSRADPQRLYLPVIMDPIYGYQAVNVEAQSRDPSSLLNWTRRILAVRRQHHCFGRGTLEFVRPQNRKIIAYVRSFENEIVLCVANLAQSAQAVELDLSRYKGRVPVELSGSNAFPPIGDLPYFLTLPAHCVLLAVAERFAAHAPSWHVERLPATELPVLVLTDGIKSLLRSRPHVCDAQRHATHACSSSSRKCCRSFCACAAGSAAPADEQCSWVSALSGRGRTATALLTFVYVESPHRAAQRFALPLTLAWDDTADSEVLRTAEWTLGTGARAFARRCAGGCVRRSGFLYRHRSCDGWRPTSASFHRRRAGVRNDAGMAAGINLERLTPVRTFRQDPLRDQRRAGRKRVSQGVSAREAGINPDIEMVDFLTRAGFTRIAALAGTVTCRIAGLCADLARGRADVRAPSG